MKIIIVVLLSTCFSLSAWAQTAVRPDTSCDFLKHLKFKNGTDTVVVNATYLSIFLLGPFTTYDVRFFKKHRINIHKFSNSEIEFQPQNCRQSFSAPLTDFDDKENLLNDANAGISVIVTCVVYEGYLGYTDHSPYVLVIKVVPKKPIGSL